MKIIDFLHKDAILTDLKATDKKSVIHELSKPLSRLADIDHVQLVKVLTEREKLGSTGIGRGIGIPHGKLKHLKSNGILGFGLSHKGVDFESMDRLPTHIFFTLITSEDSTSLHLKLLSRISWILKDDMIKEKLINVFQRDEVIKIISDNDKAF
jgi:PTS system nitrogen regulatory IIA component